MTLTELIQAVYSETNRPDYVNETLSAIMEATLTVHNFDDWFKDIQEVLVNFDNTTSYIQTLDTQVLPRYRSAAYIRKASQQMAQVQQYGLPFPAQYTYPPTNFNFLTEISIGDALDTYGYEKTDVWYEAGMQINIKSSTALAQAICGYYANPVIGTTDQTYISWIAQQNPFCIIYRAAGIVFSKTGDTANWSIYLKPPAGNQDMDTGGLWWQQMNMLQQNNIKGLGS